MDNLYSSTLENLERTFMPYLSEYQRYIDFHTMREMKQVIKGKRPVYFDLDIDELAEMNTRYVIDVYWDDVFFTAVLPSSNTFRPTIEVYGKPAKMLLGRFEKEEGEDSFTPTFLKEEFTRRKGLGDTLRDFSQVLYTYLDSYVEHREKSGDDIMSEHPGEAVLEGWTFPFLEGQPDLEKQWLSLKKRTVKQIRRMDELEIEEQYALETMVEKDVPEFIESFELLSEANKANRKEDIFETMNDLHQFITSLERKEEEGHTQKFRRSKGIISSKYNKDEENFFPRKEKDG